MLGRGQALPAGLRPAACSAAAAPDTRLAQRCLGAGQVAGCVEPLVDADRLFQQRAGPVRAALPREGRARFLGGKGEFQRPRSAGVGADGAMQDLGIVFG